MKMMGDEHLLDDVVALLIPIVGGCTPTRDDFDRDLAAALSAVDEEHETDVMADVVAQTRAAVVWVSNPKQLAREAIAQAYHGPPLSKSGDGLKSALARLRKVLS